MALPKQRVTVKPVSEPKLAQLVERLLHEAGATNILPTPLEQLFAAAKVTNIAALPDESFFKTLPEKTGAIFRSAWQKFRGIADLRHHTTYVAPDPHVGRERFVRAHELGHQVIPWQGDAIYFDDFEKLLPETKDIFEQEANCFASETIFQGRRFLRIARDYHPDFNAVFELANIHAASRQVTAWRFVEVQDEAIALLQYYPGNAIDNDGNTILNVWRTVGSDSFVKKHAEIDIPSPLRTGHPWVAARDHHTVCEGTDDFNVGGENLSFQWHSWWNGYTLLVLLRRKPRLSIVGEIINSIKK